MESAAIDALRIRYRDLTQFGGHNTYFHLTEGVGLDKGLRMARISRVVASGYPHHVTQRGVRSIPIFQTDSDRRAYLDFMAQELNRFGVDVLAWCLMTNHAHLIVVPKDSTLMARAIGEAHRRYTRMKNFSEGVRGYLFQGRFGSCVLDETHLLAAAR